MPRNRADELFDTQVDEARSRSRSPVSAQGTSTLTDTEQLKFAGYIKEVAKDIPDEIRNTIQKAMQQYTKDTKQLLKFKGWLRSDQTDLDAIKSGRIPNGMKPFKVDEQNIMWNQISNASEDIEIRFTIPKGATFRERMKIWHLKHLEASQACKIDMNQIRVAELKLLTSLENFKRQCKGSRESFVDEVKDLDLDLPIEMFMDVDMLTKKQAIQLCKRLVEDIIKERRIDKENKDELKKKMDKVCEEAATMTPKEKLQNQIRQTLKEEYERKKSPKAEKRLDQKA
jgi:hypothetical protein